MVLDTRRDNMLATGCKLIDFAEFGDERGKLVVIEAEPFIYMGQI